MTDNNNNVTLDAAWPVQQRMWAYGLEVLDHVSVEGMLSAIYCSAVELAQQSPGREK